MRGERGNALLGVLVILSITIFILMSLGLVLRQYLLQERQLQSSLEWERERIVELRVGVKDLQLPEWSVVGLEGGCRVFGDEADYISLDSNLYGRELSLECFPENSRKMLGVYSVSEGVRYIYLMEDRLVSPVESIDGWRMALDGERGMTLRVNYAGSIYHYEFPDYKVGSKLWVLKSVASEGFYLLIEHELWLLPKSSTGKGRFVAYVDFVGEVLIADFIGDEGIYILWGSGSRNEGGPYSGVVKSFYSLMKGGKNIKRREVERQDVVFDSYDVVLADRYKVVVKLGWYDKDYLFAMMWDGRTVWGRRYIWESGESVDCPLQSEWFEPVAGWVLGCQRKPLGKVGFKSGF